VVNRVSIWLIGQPLASERATRRSRMIPYNFAVWLMVARSPAMAAAIFASATTGSR
jgi:hypothetical protein